VSPGDSKSKVLAACGEPLYKEVVEEKTAWTVQGGGGSYSGTSETVIIERWTYKLRRNYYSKLTFEGDILVDIENSRRP